MTRLEEGRLDANCIVGIGKSMEMEEQGVQKRSGIKRGGLSRVIHEGRLSQNELSL